MKLMGTRAQSQRPFPAVPCIEIMLSRCRLSMSVPWPVFSNVWKFPAAVLPTIGKFHAAVGVHVELNNASSDTGSPSNFCGSLQLYRAYFTNAVVVEASTGFTVSVSNETPERISWSGRTSANSGGHVHLLFQWKAPPIVLNPPYSVSLTGTGTNSPGAYMAVGETQPFTAHFSVAAAGTYSWTGTSHLSVSGGNSPNASVTASNSSSTVTGDWVRCTFAPTGAANVCVTSFPITVIGATVSILSNFCESCSGRTETVTVDLQPAGATGSLLIEIMDASGKVIDTMDAGTQNGGGTLSTNWGGAATTGLLTARAQWTIEGHTVTNDAALSADAIWFTNNNVIVSWTNNGTYEASQLVSSNSWANGLTNWSISPAYSATGDASIDEDSGLLQFGTNGGSYVVMAEILDFSSPSSFDDTCIAVATVTVVRVDIAMDGNRDNSVTFGDTNDNHYLFWVNDDYDSKHWVGGQSADGWAEDDIHLYFFDTKNCDDDTIGRRGTDQNNNLPSDADDHCRSDLEDFSRLHINVDDNTANLSGIAYFLSFENVAPGSSPPTVNIFEAIDDSLAYLSDTNVADQQILKTRLITVAASEVQLPSQYIKTGNQVSPFILEGKSAGKGDLTLIVKKDGHEVCKKAVTLDLRPITAFYEKYVVTVSTGDDVNTTDGGNANSTTYTPETDEYVLHVHGWNMADWEKDRWTETVFKRLWWQGYKGHVGGFQWPTYTGILTYDASEIRAWRSGQALNNRIASLNASYSGQVRVLAHSMGNVVMGEALRLFSSPVVHRYIAAQAAIPTHCYDNTVTNYWTGFDTPNIYARYSSGLSPDSAYLAGNSSHAGGMALYFNSQDYALDWWETNNEMKPDFAYWNTDGDSNTNSYAPASGDRFYFDNILVPFDERTMTIPDDRFEIFARIVESRSRALGCESSVSGFGTARNLQNWGYDGAHYSHSREFRSNVVDERPFWMAFVEDAQLSQ